MAGVCEGGNEPPGSLKASELNNVLYEPFRAKVVEKPVSQTSYNSWRDHRSNHMTPPFWLDDRPPLLRHVDVRPAAGWSVLALHGL
ncbi:hypothetical protein ANN_14377 [Periplaneta americana]|uniref:Uncharacterized protein n=1 Tax=Periplaneta americana TaxID=6978 RepID=A0ABQ8SW53_PERAM|nr:hypothetical protein ANN_14377 [Periplaneta americana]